MSSAIRQKASSCHSGCLSSADFTETEVVTCADAAALGVEAYVCATEDDISRARLQGVEGIRAEFEANGTEMDKLCMRYVLDGEAGTSDHVWPNGNLKLDCDASGAVHSERLVDGEGGGAHTQDLISEQANSMQEELIHVSNSFVQVDNCLTYFYGILYDINEIVRWLGRDKEEVKAARLSGRSVKLKPNDTMEKCRE